MKKKEDGFEKLARLITQESEDIRTELSGEMICLETRLEAKMDAGFTEINRRLDSVVQIQLSDHAKRIKALEDAAHRAR